MRSAKSDLAAHPSWSDQNPELTFPHCGIGHVSYQYTIPHCPTPFLAQDRLLEEVTSIDAASHIWDHQPLMKAPGQYITTTRTGFLPEMTLDFASPYHPAAPTPALKGRVHSFQEVLFHWENPVIFFFLTMSTEY